jgi:DNA helicase-2/ATP-dependent DNA helicase PcrA
MMLERLLLDGLLVWPGGHTKLEVRDDYRGEQGFRYLRPPGNWRRVARLSASRVVVSKATQVRTPTTGIGSKPDHERLLNAGVSSHDDVRSVVLDAIESDEIWGHAAAWLARSFRAVVIDEVYDAANLDLEVAYMAAESGLAVTLIGDPWQALYGWRGAAPDKVEKLLGVTTDRFVAYDQPVSFRFTGVQMPALARALRAGHQATLPAISSTEVDVALGRWWRGLWKAGDNVLPLAFRTVENATDASLNLLLDVVTRAHLGLGSFGREGAITQLRLDRDRLRVEQDERLRPLLDSLMAGSPASDVLAALRNAVVELGSPRRPRRLGAAQESAREAEIEALGVRLHQPSLVPGLTVYQAKGQEWPRVGVVLNSAQKALLAAGLKALDDESCVIYVALTRAKERCGLLAEDPTLDDGAYLPSSS